MTAFEVLDPHESLTVTATSTVHTDRGEPAPPDALVGRRCVSRVIADRFTEYLGLPSRVAPPEELVDAVLEHRGGERASRRPRRGRSARWSTGEVEYVSGATDVHSPSPPTPGPAASGVCQDMAHLVIGGLRTVGIPARYVSGYLHPKKSAPLGEPVRGESHAWVEWWDDGWHGYDPTNDRDVGDQHVVVATGRDYADVKPLSGIFSGSGTSHMFVDVQITRLR